MLSPPLTPTDCTDSSCQWKQTKSSLMSYQHGTAEHDSYRVATNRKAHDQQHDHPVSAAVIKKSRTDRTNRNKSFIQSYRRFHAMSPIRPQPYITDIRRTTKNPYHRKSIKVHRSPSPNADSMNIFVLDIYESLLRDSSQLVHSIQPPLQHTGLTDVVSHDSSPAPVMSRKNKTNVANSASYDAIDIETDDSAIFSDDWIPKQDALHDKHVKIVWKGAPLKISHLPMYNKLHPVEVNIASTLRLTPIQYIRCKRTLIRAAFEYERHGTPFRKSDAQKLCRVDVNKTSSLWSIFGELGWLGNAWPN